MPTTVTKQPASAKPRTYLELEEGQTVIVRRRSNPEAQRAAAQEAIAQMHKRKKRGDVVAYLRDFRDNPRG